MKIGFCGKGGNGKSTLVALMAAHMQTRGKKVLVIDSDESNSGLHWMLGFEKPPAPLMDFIGGKRWAQQELVAGITTGLEETEISLLRQPEISSDAIAGDYISEDDGCRLVMVGKIEAPLEGCACPMGAVAKEFIRKLKTGPDEVVLVDLEAGLEHFGRGIEEGLDAIVAVVEPSRASMMLSGRIAELCERMEVGFAGAVINRFGDSAVRAWVAGSLRDHGVGVLGILPYRDDLAAAGLKGHPLIRLPHDDVSTMASTLFERYEKRNRTRNRSSRQHREKTEPSKR